MAAWWNNLCTYEQVLFIIAMSSTIIFGIQLVLMIIGIGFEDVDFDGDIDTDFLNVFGLRIISVRAVLAFLSIGSWMALVVVGLSDIVWLSVLLGIVAGLAAMFLVAFAMKKMMNLENEGNIDNSNAIGKIATVYLTIPAAKSGVGKVSVIVQDRLIEIDAVTDDEEEIKTGQEVKIRKIINDKVVVSRKEEE